MLLLNAIIHTDPEQTVLQRIGDQAFSVVVLVGIAWILWKRQIKLEDRLTQYLDDDRRKNAGRDREQHESDGAAGRRAEQE